MIERLVAIMARLRDPVRGCEWDSVQTFETIAPYTIEEAYEVADAIQRGDLAELKDELGDLLLQVVFHARIAEEAGHFAVADVIAAISDKMERRHPHIFGDAANGGHHLWEQIKAEERAAKGKKAGSTGALDGVAAAATQVAGGFDVIVDSAGGAGFESLIDLAASGGRIVFFGATRGNPAVLPMRKVFWRNLSLLGTTMGSPADWRALLEFVALHRIVPIVSDVFPLGHAGEAFELMERGGQFGKIVVTMT